MFELTVKDADVGWSIVASGKCKKRTNRALASSLRLPHPLPLTEPTHGRETKAVGRPNRSKGKKGGTPLSLPEDSTSAARSESQRGQNANEKRSTTTTRLHQQIERIGEGAKMTA